MEPVTKQKKHKSVIVGMSENCPDVYLVGAEAEKLDKLIEESERDLEKGDYFVAHSTEELLEFLHKKEI